MNEVPVQVSAPLTKQMRTALEVLERERAREDMMTYVGAPPKNYQPFKARGALEGVHSEGEFWGQFPGARSVMPEVRAAAARSEADLLPEELEKLRGVRALDKAKEMAMSMASSNAARYSQGYKRSANAIDVSEAFDILRDEADGYGRRLGPEFDIPQNLFRRGVRFLEDETTADLIQRQYEQAISRTSSYRGNLRDHLLRKSGAVLSSGYGDYIAGFPLESGGGSFVISHFAPRTLRSGVSFIKTLAEDSETPFLMAIPDYQANMASRLGWRRVGTVPQWFNGQLIQKNVLVNKGVTDEKLQEVASELMTRQDAKGGDAGTRADEEGGDGGSETAVSETAVSNVPAPQQSGPRIVVNPTVFEDDKDALCVAFNEAFRIVMEDMAFDPVSEPTERQRKFFSDTAYADDETQLRRTILARICTFDTSVKDPTDEQLQEAVEFLENVMEAGYPQDEREQSMVQRIHDVVAQSVGRPQTKEPEETSEPPTGESAPAEEPEAVQGDIGGGESRYAYTKNGIDYDINDNPLTKAESNPDYAYTKDGIDYDINGNPLNAAQTPGPTTPQNQAEVAAPKESDEPKEEATLDQMLEQAQTGELSGENPMSSVDDAPDRVWNELADVQSVEMEEGPTVTLTAGGAQTSGGFGGPLTLSARPRGRGFADVGGPLTTRVSFDGRIENSGTERSRRAALRGFV